MNDFFRSISTLKTRNCPLHEIYFSNVEAYFISWSNLRVTSVQSVPPRIAHTQTKAVGLDNKIFT